MNLFIRFLNLLGKLSIGGSVAFTVAMIWQTLNVSPLTYIFVGGMAAMTTGWIISGDDKK